jgi:hypothetical protein
VVQINATTVHCSAELLLELGYSTPLDVAITYWEGTTSRITTNIKFIRPSFLACAPLVASTVDQPLTFNLPHDIVTSVDCTAIAPRAWFGSSAAPSCQMVNTIAVFCMPPPGTEAFVRVNLQLCGLFNISSDGMPASAVLDPSRLDLYVSNNPSAYFTPAATAQAQEIRRPGVNLTAAVDSLPLIGPFITGMEVAETTCG